MKKIDTSLVFLRAVRAVLLVAGFSLIDSADAAHPYSDILVNNLRKLRVSEVYFVPLSDDGNRDPEAIIQFAAKEPLTNEAITDLQGILNKAQMMPRMYQLAKDHSYLLFFFGKGEDEGWAIHSNVEFGKDRLNLYSAQKLRDRLVINGSMILRTWAPSENVKDQFPFETKILFLYLSGWEESRTHLELMRKVSE